MKKEAGKKKNKTLTGDRGIPFDAEEKKLLEEFRKEAMREIAELKRKEKKKKGE